MPTDLTLRLAERLKALRLSRDWSLDDLAARSDVSRATLSRLEKGEVSPTAVVLARLCGAYDLPLSRLMRMIEEPFAAHVPFAGQPEWTDPDTGLSRRSVSPPAESLSAEVQECHLPPGAVVSDAPTANDGRECHLVLLDGALSAVIGDAAYDLTAGDCLRFKSPGASRLETAPGRGARFLLVML